MNKYLLLVVLCVAGCTFDARVRSDVVVTCNEASECPAGFSCVLSVNRCVALDEADRSPPRIDGPVAIFPSLARAGDVIRVGFHASEPLARPPTMVLQLSNGSLSSPLEVAEVEGSPLEYAARWTVLASAPEGPVRVLVDMLDLKGNEALRIDVGGSQLDFTAPSVIAGSESLNLIAGPSSPLPSISALSTTSSANLGFTVTDELRQPPVLTAESADGGTVEGLQFTLSLSASVTFGWTVSTSSGVVTQGPVSLTATLEDLAGNQTKTRLNLPSTLRIDTLTPEPPVTADAGTFLERTPWGSAASETPVAFLRGQAGAAEPGAIVLATERELSRELGRVTAGPTGAFSLQLPTDVTDVYVSAVDAAGNRSAASHVTSGALIVSLGGSAVGNASANPHQFESRDIHGPGFTQGDAVARYAAAGVARPGGASLSTTGAWSWLRRTGDGAPVAVNIAAAWHDEAAELIALGGVQAGVPLTGAARRWSVADWSLINAPDPEGDGNPLAAIGSGSARTAVYDRVRNELLVLVDSVTGTETWAFNGTSWVRRSKALVGPLCVSCNAVFNTVTGAPMLLDARPTGDLHLYLWEAASTRWEELDAGVSPAARVGGAVAFDEARGELLLFGGADDAGVKADLWSFGSAGWQQRDAGVAGARDRATTWDSENKRVIFAGGFAVGADGGLTGLADVLEWNGSTLTPAATDAGGLELPLGGATLVFDKARGRSMLIGGASEPGALPNDSTFWWKAGIGWQRLSRPGSPPARSSPASVWDRSANRMLIFGGRTGDGFVNAYRDLWSFDGIGWQLIDAFQPGPIGPDARFKASLTQRPNSSDLVLHGGVATSLSCLGDSWVLHNDKWAASSNDVARCGHVGWYDTTRDSMVVSGGSASVTSGAGSTEVPAVVLNTTRELRPDGGWAPSPLAGPFAAYGAAFGTNASGNAMLAHGGLVNGSLSNLTYTLTPTGWLSTSVNGPSVAHAAVASNTRVGAWLMYGGVTPAESATLWAFDGTTWSRPVLADPEGDGSPSGRSRAALVHDTVRDIDVLFGGLSSGQVLDDTWELRTNSRPSNVFRVKLSSFGAEVPTLRTLVVSGIAGGTGSTGSTAVQGVELLVWLDGAWRRLANTDSTPGQLHAAPTSAPAAFELRLGDASVLAALAGRADISVAIVPRGFNATTAATLAVDHIEARLEYLSP